MTIFHSLDPVIDVAQYGSNYQKTTNNKSSPVWSILRLLLLLEKWFLQLILLLEIYNP